MKIREMTPQSIRGILPTGGTILGTAGEIQSVSLKEATRGLKFVPTEGNEVKSAEALGVSFGR